MRVTLRFFATFRDAVGQKEVGREFDDDVVIADVLADLAREYPELEFYGEDGELREYLSILRNGRDIGFLAGEETAVRDGDTISIFPPVAGGLGSEVRTFRGISSRAACHYLEQLGGDRRDERTVEGDDWTAHVSTDEVAVGPSLSLTEVTVAFEGSEDTLEPLVEAFARKARRAGG